MTTMMIDGDHLDLTDGMPVKRKRTTNERAFLRAIGRETETEIEIERHAHDDIGMRRRTSLVTVRHLSHIALSILPKTVIACRTDLIVTGRGKGRGSLLMRGMTEAHRDAWAYVVGMLDTFVRACQVMSDERGYIYIYMMLSCLVMIFTIYF